MAQAFDSGAFYSGAFEAGTAALAYTLDAQPASYSLTGSIASTVVDRNINAAASSYSVSGQAATTAVQRTLNASGGSYSLTGSQATVLANRNVTASSSSYTITGFDVTFVITAAAGLDAQAGSFTVTGSPASFVRTRVFNAEASTGYSLAGNGSTLAKGVCLLASPENYTSASYVDSGYVDPGYVGNDNPPASLTVSRNVLATGGTYTIVGSDVEFIRERKLNASSGSYVIAFPTPSQTYVLKYWTGSVWQIIYKDPIVYP